MKLIIYIVCCIALIGASQALTAILDTTRARLLYGWSGIIGPNPIDFTIYNDQGNFVFSDTINPGKFSNWVYLNTYSDYTISSSLDLDLPYKSIDTRVATYVLYGPNASNPYIDVWADSTDPPPRGKARIRISSTLNEDTGVTIGGSTQQLVSGSDIKAFVEFDVDPGTVQISITDGYSSTHQVDPDVTYRAFLVTNPTYSILLAPTCDYSVTGRWNIVSLRGDVNVIRGGVGEATATLVTTNSATLYREYAPGNSNVQINPLQAGLNFELNVFMAGFEEWTLVIGAGLSLHIDYIPQPTNNKSMVIFKNDWTAATVSTDSGTILIPNLTEGWSNYIELEPDSVSLFSFGPFTKVSVGLEANNVYLVVFNENNIVTMVQAETGAPANLRHIHATTRCQTPGSVFFSDSNSAIISNVEYGTASAYTSTSEVWAGYYKYVVKDQDGKYIGAAAFRSLPNQNYSLITIGKCDLQADPAVKVFYWRDFNIAPEGRALVKAVHGAYDTSPSNPILQIDGDASLEQMTFGYFSSDYVEISGGMKHLLNVSFDNKREFNKTVYFRNETVATVVTAGSWADDTFDIFVFADIGTLQEPSDVPVNAPNDVPSAPVPAAPTKNSPKGSTSTGNTVSAMIFSTLIASLIATLEVNHSSFFNGNDIYLM